MHRSLVTSFVCLPFVLVLACGDGGNNETGVAQTSLDTATTFETGDGITGDGDGDGNSGDGDGDGDGDSGDGDGDSGDGDIKFDMAPLPDTGGGRMPPSCKVVDDMNAVGVCRMQAPPDSFEPDTQWSYTGPQGFDQS